MYLFMCFGSSDLSDSLFDLVAAVSHWGFVSSVHFSFFDEGQELLIFTVERFFSVHCRQKRVLLLCFTSLFFSVRCCRRPLALLHKYFCLFVGYCHRRCCSSSISDSSGAAASCLSVTLFSSS